MWRKDVTLAITGASGAQYALRLLQVLVEQHCRVFLLISKAARVVLSTETDTKLPAQAAALQTELAAQLGAQPGQVLAFGQEDWMAPVASGSGAPASMVVCPCSTGTLSSIAHGASDNLIERAADVCLKERRQLILVPREAPFSEIHLTNMLTLSRMGAVILPACPGFYHRPSCIDDVVDFIVARILSQLGLQQKLIETWGEERLDTSVQKNGR